MSVPGSNVLPSIRSAAWIVVLLCLCDVPTAAQPKVDFNREVHPILASRCFGCHSQAKRSGGLSLGTYEDALAGGRSGATIRPGNAAGSLMLDRITGRTQPRMPPIGSPLNEREVATISAWIDEGARATPRSAPAKAKWEAPLALTRPPVPRQRWKNWVSPVDRFVAAYLVATRAPAPRPITDAQFARRAYLDIVGLLPDPAELREFVGSRASNKRKILTSKLLADNTKYAEHWISFWNDLLRNDEGTTYHSEEASRKSITEWLLASLKENRR
ncbi:MAG TPA: DUF1549 domain-containing protein, partial [Bryobacteraceae bacterium]|nr:DUF1549 domain-containing protein [Bryobacteraceae bacterium]